MSKVFRAYALDKDHVSGVVAKERVSGASRGGTLRVPRTAAAEPPRYFVAFTIR